MGRRDVATSFDVADNSLTTSGDMDILDGHLLLALATMLVEGSNLLEVERHKFGRMLQGQISALKRLVLKRSPAQAFGGCLMGADHLNSQHALQPVDRSEIFIEFDGAGYLGQHVFFRCVR